MDSRLPIRPTSDKARGAVFSSLASLIPDAKFLDVFAGTGAVGIEAVSRGARLVIAVEQSPRAAALIAKNRESLGIHPELLQIRVGSYARLLPELTGENFDVIFADPPYGDKLGAIVLELVDRCALLAPLGVLIVEHFAKESLPVQVGKLVREKTRNYGQTEMSFFVKAGGSTT